MKQEHPNLFLLFVFLMFVVGCLGLVYQYNRNREAKELSLSTTTTPSESLTATSPTAPPTVVPTINEADYDFVKTGNIVRKNMPGVLTPVLAFVYEQPGAPGLWVYLDTESHRPQCSPGPIFHQCFPSDLIPEGTRAKVYGHKKSNTVYFDRIEIISDNTAAVIDWDTAVSLLTSCQVTKAFQKHDRTVTLTLSNNEVVTTTEPQIDDLFDVLNQPSVKCAKFPVATE